MIDKAYIYKLASRMAQLESDIANPAVAANQKKFRETVKEHARLRKILEKADVFFRIQRDLEEQRALLAAEDADLSFAFRA